MTQNILAMWICAWRIMWTDRTRLILTAMQKWKGTVNQKCRTMKRRKMRRRRMRMKKRMRMKMMAKNFG
jgi:hypothetical protein